MAKDTIELDEPVEKAREYTKEEIFTARKFLDHYGIEEKKLTDARVMEKVAKIRSATEAHAKVFSRGQVLDSIERLLDFVPDGFVGEFKRETDLDVYQAKALGWEILLSDEAKMASSTGAADGKVRLGDQVLMIMPEENYVGLRIAKEKRIQERRTARSPKKQAEAEGADKYDAPIFEI